MARMQRFHRGRWVRVLGWNIHILREVHDDFDFGKPSSKDRMMAWGHHAWPKKIWGNQCATEVRTPPGNIVASAHSSRGLLAPVDAGCIYQILRHSERGTACRLHHSQRRVATWLQEFTCCFEFWKMQQTWGLQHFQISPRRFYMSKIKCGSKMMPGWSTCLIKWSEIIQLDIMSISQHRFFFFSD